MIFRRSLANVMPPEQNYKTSVWLGNDLFQKEAALYNIIQNANKRINALAFVVIQQHTRAASPDLISANVTVDISCAHVIT